MGTFFSYFIFTFGKKKKSDARLELITQRAGAGWCVRSHRYSRRRNEALIHLHYLLDTLQGSFLSYYKFSFSSFLITNVVAAGGDRGGEGTFCPSHTHCFAMFSVFLSCLLIFLLRLLLLRKSLLAG